MKKILLLGLALSVLGGCANKYSCGQFPKSGCQPVSSVYDRTNAGFDDYRKGLFDNQNKEKNEPKKESSTVQAGQSHQKSGVKIRSTRSDQSGGAIINVGKAHRAINYAAPGDPILSKPVNLRILFNMWEDGDKDLNEGGFVYIRLRDSEWVIDN